MADIAGRIGQVDFHGEIARLKKIIRALMDRAERSSAAQSSDFSLLQNTVLLEEEVRKRTAELDLAVREMDKTKQALRESEAKFRSLVDQSLVGIVTIEDGQFTYSNAKFDEMFGYTAEEVRTLKITDIVAESDRAVVADIMRQQFSGDKKGVKFEFHGLRKNGTTINIESYAGIMEVDGLRSFMAVVMDVTERALAECQARALEERLRELSTHDSLTGLYNRRYLEDTLVRELILANRQQAPLSLIIADIDHFKVVNDRFGHLGGDAVLRFIGDLMNRNVRGSDICCRYGGEEFLMVLPRMDEARALDRAEHLRLAVEASPIIYGASVISVTASFGVAAFPRDGVTMDELIGAADRALYRAKAAGRNCVKKFSL